jgi:hypothetical protein
LTIEHTHDESGVSLISKERNGLGSGDSVDSSQFDVDLEENVGVVLRFSPETFRGLEALSSDSVLEKYQITKVKLGR